MLTIFAESISRALHMNSKARIVSLDISKSSDRAWHAGLFHELKSYGASIYDLIRSFCNESELNGHSSRLFRFNAPVP